MSFIHNDLKIPSREGAYSEESVQLWFVVGIPKTYYPTKIVAETAARSTFPLDLDPHRRVYYKTFHREPEE